jgi:hypothetical protein
VSLDGGIETAKEIIRRGSTYSKFILETDVEIQPEVHSHLHAFITKLKAGQHPWKHFDLATARPIYEVSDPAEIVELARSLRA